MKSHFKVGAIPRSVAMACAITLGGAIFATGCSQAPSSTTEKTTSVTLSGQVYDAELSGASVELVVGGTVASTAIADSNGNYSFSLSIKDSDKSKAVFIRAARGAFKLRSVLGTLSKLIASKDSSNKVSSSNFPAANITNVSTAVAAIIEQENSGTLPTTQTDIDAKLAAIKASSNLQAKVKTIAAAVKSVIDYGATVSTTTTQGAATDTDDLAKKLAAIITAADVTTEANKIVNTYDSTTYGAGVTTSTLETAVTSDPNLASQLLASPISALSDLANKYYVTGIAGAEGSVLVFNADGTSVTLYTAAQVAAKSSGATGTVTYDSSAGTLTLNFGASNIIVATLLGGHLNAIPVTYTENGVSKGNMLVRRIIPIVEDAVTQDANHVRESTVIATTLLVDFKDNRAIRYASACDNATTTGWMANKDGKLTGVKCESSYGMLVVTPPTNTYGVNQIILGLMPDSWDGTNLSQGMNMVGWEKNSSGTVVANYGKVFKPKESGMPTQVTDASVVGSLRILPSISQPQLMFVTTTDTADDSTAGGSIDIYRLSSVTRKAQIIRGTTSDFGSLKVNGSIKTGTSWGATHSSTSVSVNLGKHAGGALNAVFQPYSDNVGTALGAIKTRVMYKLKALASGDVSGKTFKLVNMVNASDTATVKFNTDGSGTIVNGSTTKNMTWAIGASVPATGLSGATYAANTLVITITSSSEKMYIFADTSAGTGNIVLGTYTLKSDNSHSATAGYVAVLQ